MPILRGESASPRRSRVILSDTNPYQSRTLVVQADDATTAAYLRDSDGETVAATWIANHRPAPPTTDLSRLNAGLAPTMPASHTKHPNGRAAIDPRTLDVVWLEEGDGAALLESGSPLCVIPGWASTQHGMPGYSRDAIGQTPFAWSLDEAMEGLGPRIDQARAYWQWRHDPNGWPAFQQSALTHLTNRLGQAGRYWDVGGERQPTVGVSELPATQGRDHTLLSTVGMSAQRMPTVEQYVDDVADYARIELIVATTLPSPQVARVFLWLGQYPWHAVTWLGPGHNAKWYHEPDTFPLGSQWEGVLLAADPSPLSGGPVPDLSGFTFGGDPVRWLWLVPITEAERQEAKQVGSAALLERLADAGRSWVVG